MIFLHPLSAYPPPVPAVNRYDPRLSPFGVCTTTVAPQFTQYRFSKKKNHEIQISSSTPAPRSPAARYPHAARNTDLTEFATHHSPQLPARWSGWQAGTRPAGSPLAAPRRCVRTPSQAPRRRPAHYQHRPRDRRRHRHPAQGLIGCNGGAWLPDR